MLGRGSSSGRRFPACSGAFLGPCSGTSGASGCSSLVCSGSSGGSSSMESFGCGSSESAGASFSGVCGASSSGVSSTCSGAVISSACCSIVSAGISMSSAASAASGRLGKSRDTASNSAVHFLYALMPSLLRRHLLNAVSGDTRIQTNIGYFNMHRACRQAILLKMLTFCLNIDFITCSMVQICSILYIAASIKVQKGK